MEILQPGSWSEALETRAARPDAKPIRGGTDVMVELNFDHIRPQAMLDLGRVPELGQWGSENGWLRVGAGVPYTQLIAELGDELPGLAIASRTVGSPQIRNRGTVGGNLAQSSPAGDALPPLYAAGAEVELASTTGTRRVRVDEFITGPKRNAMREDELIAAFWIKPADGPQEFAKVGTRNAMVIAVCSFALNVSPTSRTVTTCIGSAGPTPIRAAEADALEAAIRSAPVERQIELVRAHPELSSREPLTAESAREQAGIALRHDAQRALNTAYRERFGFPFVVCVREHTPESILAWGEQRLERSEAEELDTALGEIAKIARLRLQERP